MLLIDKGWSQKELAKKAGLPYNTITNLLSGRTKKIHPEVMNRLSNAFGTSTDVILGYSESSNRQPLQTQERIISWDKIDIKNLTLEELKRIISALPEKRLSAKKKKIILEIIELQ